MINTFLIIFAGMLLFAALMVDISKKDSSFMSFIYNDPPVPRGELLGTLMGIFISGAIVAIVWAYTDSLRRWTVCTLAKTDLINSLSSLYHSQIFKRASVTDIASALPRVYGSMRYAEYFRNNVQQLIFLNPGAFRNMNRYFLTLEAYQQCQDRTDLAVEEKRHALAELALASLCGCIAARQLGRVDEDLGLIVYDSLEFLSRLGLIADPRILQELHPYFRLEASPQ